ncbi:high mobility group protein D [Drosophila montana]|uniref:high mobility group protein D n=1 Tax=Drosophila montana TaxID=40370 RepID=UPI00313B8F50
MADKPKRPLSAYMLWLNSARESIKRESPGIKVTEVAKRGGELWRAMKDKSEWEAKAAKAKDDYDRAVKDFEANGGSSAPANGGAKKRSKPAKKPAKKSKKEDSDDDDDDESE